LALTEPKVIEPHPRLPFRPRWQGVRPVVGRFQQPICETVTDAAAARVEGAMYAIPKGRDAVAPGLGGDPAAAPQRDRRLPWREQPTDQLGSLPEPLLLGRFCGGGKFS